eukprot:PhM_4_TR15369/c0_g1_i1/m.88836
MRSSRALASASSLDAFETTSLALATFSSDSCAQFTPDCFDLSLSSGLTFFVCTMSAGLTTLMTRPLASCVFDADSDSDDDEREFDFCRDDDLLVGDVPGDVVSFKVLSLSHFSFVTDVAPLLALAGGLSVYELSPCGRCGNTFLPHDAIGTSASRDGRLACWGGVLSPETAKFGRGIVFFDRHVCRNSMTFASKPLTDLVKRRGSPRLRLSASVISMASSMHNLNAASYSFCNQALYSASRSCRFRVICTLMRFGVFGSASSRSSWLRSSVWTSCRLWASRRCFPDRGTQLLCTGKSASSNMNCTIK